MWNVKAVVLLVWLVFQFENLLIDEHDVITRLNIWKALEQFAASFNTLFAMVSVKPMNFYLLGSPEIFTQNTPNATL